MKQHVGRFYGPYIHHIYETIDSIWLVRYKSSLIQDDEYLFSSMRYIESNQSGQDEFAGRFSLVASLV